MLLILKQIIRIIIYVILFYSVFELISGYLPYNQKIVDTGASASSIYFYEPKYVVYGRKPLQKKTNKVILLGASNVREGFRPEQIQPFIPGYTVHNVTVGATNFTQMKQIVELLHESLPHEKRQENIFVIGIWYGLFVDNKARWKDGKTDIDNEKIRYGLYKQSKDNITPVLPSPYINYLIEAVQPFLVFDKYVNAYFTKPIGNLNQYIFSNKGQTSKATLKNDDIVLTDIEKGKALTFWRQYMGDLNESFMEEQFTVLKEIVDIINKSGGKVIIIDMPIAKWHADRSKYYHVYKDKIKDFMSELKPALYLNYQDMNDNLDYYDSAHPKPKVTMKWGTRLAKDINNSL